MKRRVICFGLGPIGLSIARLAAKRRSIEIVGAVDTAPGLVGRDLGELLGIGGMGIMVQNNGHDLYRKADIVLHATTSFLSSARSQLEEFCRNGVDVVSTCEELAYPWFSHRLIAKELDSAAKRRDVTLLGTGVNPGFVMDALAITLSGVCEQVSEIRVTRVLDATKRRLPFQMKVGIGLDVREFYQNVRTGKFGHIGLPESVAMTCAAMGSRIERFEQKIRPKIASKNLTTENFGTVRKGKVVGLIQDGSGFAGGSRVAKYHIEMYAGAMNPHDEIELVGVPRISLRIPGGTPGDIATAAVIVNSIPRVVESAPGLITVMDLRPACSTLGAE
ncbi:MAG: dihydrodipicolinate reductase [Nitrososphaerota archaeon]|nr:dihydrodipicolinate reductase [Nitrososphaerota archaeon]